ncbi:MAG: ArsC family reductase [Candidatus Endonucleobacter bathymodioli]|uniref:ArsC family reductase n=1 Tax=Candidatus Endonucleibacter bathymodioli TaxID=539814 RepID=A0AA90NT93_9GAMM|nr:ArsC family reductase [Candidatus Endonucleobacter bathymodioli]
MLVTLYGISNCDSTHKARRWLKDENIDYHFHDYRKDGLKEVILRRWIDNIEWEKLTNKRGTTWRNLPEEQKANMTRDQAIQIMLEKPVIIKRPLLDFSGSPTLGFNSTLYSNLFSKRTL